jgi:hypothetical protein
MDLSNLMNEAEGLVEKMGGMDGVLKKLSDMTGISPAAIQEFSGKAKEIMADGKLSPDEAKQALDALAAKVGIPENIADGVVDKIMGAMGKK